MRRDGIQSYRCGYANIRIRVLESCCTVAVRSMYRENGENYVPLEEAGTVTAVTC